MWKQTLALLVFAMVGCTPPVAGPGPDPGAVVTEDTAPPAGEPGPSSSAPDDVSSDEIDLTGTRHFKLRIGQNAKHSDEFLVGGRKETDTVNVPFLVRRFRGQESQTVHLTYEIVDGDPDGWTLAPPTDEVLLGPEPTSSTADFDGDGDVDADDEA